MQCEDQGIKKVETLKKSEEYKEVIKSIELLFIKEMRTNKIKNEIFEIKKWEEKIKQKDLKYEKIIIYMIFKNLRQ